MRFIDYYSGYIRINYLVDIKDTGTVKEKITFERESQSQRVEIKVYHTDNGIFNAPEFM